MRFSIEYGPCACEADLKTGDQPKDANLSKCAGFDITNPKIRLDVVCIEAIVNILKISMAIHVDGVERLVILFCIFTYLFIFSIFWKETASSSAQKWPSRKSAV